MTAEPPDVWGTIAATPRKPYPKATDTMRFRWAQTENMPGAGYF